MACKRLEKKRKIGTRGASKHKRKKKASRKVQTMKKCGRKTSKDSNESGGVVISDSDFTLSYLRSLEDMLFQEKISVNDEKKIIEKLKHIILYSDIKKKDKIEMKSLINKDEHKNEKQSVSNYSLEILKKYLNSAKFSSNMFMSIYDEKELEDLFARIKVETVKGRILIIRCFQLLLIKAVECRYILKNCIYNELTYYIENGRNLRHIDVLLDICCFYVIKDIYYSLDELHSFLINYIFPMFTNSNAFIHKDDILLLFKNVCYCHDVLMDAVFRYFADIFHSSNTPTKTIIMEVTFKILNEKYVDIYSYITMLSTYINFALREQNCALIANLKLLFTLPILNRSFKKNIAHILPLIFQNLYRTSKKYWNVEDRGFLYEIINNVMLMDKNVFDMCLMTYNKQKYGAYLDKKMDDLAYGRPYGSNMRLDNDINERRKSVYDIEFEEHKRLKRM